MSQSQYDLIIYGATGFTGQLVVEYVAKRFPTSDKLKWAIASRNEQKLNDVKQQYQLDESIDCVVADAEDHDSLQQMVGSTKVVLTTVGPYQLVGSKLLELCAKTGTDYVDLCGEPAWMHEMINAHQKQAEQSGARIVFSCGFDSIPFDLGVYLLQRHAIEKFGQPLERVKGRVKSMKGTFSGGTAASLKATMKAAHSNPAVMKVLLDPFSLTPGFTGPEQPLANEPVYENEFDSWSAPFIMAAINTRNIHRTNYLLDHQYGKPLVYDEMIFTGPGEKGQETAKSIASDKSMASEDGPKPGEGPSQQEREDGHFDLLFAGQHNNELLTVSVKGNMDPGYGTTSKMISETAFCLIQDELAVEGGIWTSAAAMGDQLMARLKQHAGMTFSLY